MHWFLGTLDSQDIDSVTTLGCQHSENWDVSTLDCPSIGMSEHWDIKTLGCQNIGMPVSWPGSTLVDPFIGRLDCQNILHSQYIGL